MANERQGLLGSLSPKGGVLNYIVGLAAIVGGPAAAINLIPTKTLAVIFGSLIATWGALRIGSIRPVQADAASHIASEKPTGTTREEEIRADERRKHELNDAKKERDAATAEKLRAELENTRLQAEKERLERMQIQIDSAAPILKLGLLGVNMTTYDFQRQEIKVTEHTDEGFFYNVKHRDESEYVGLQKVTLKANLGIDLKDVKVVEHNGALYVSGIKSESHGITQRETEWLMREIRNRHYTDGQLDDHRIHDKDIQILDLADSQARSLDTRLNQGLEFATHDAMVRHLAQGYIQLLLSPIGKPVEFLPEGNESGDLLPLQQFIAFHNQNIKHQIELKKAAMLPLQAEESASHEWTPLLSQSGNENSP
jgi:HSP20 family molecular chaperone IbpA